MKRTLGRHDPVLLTTRKDHQNMLELKRISRPDEIENQRIKLQTGLVLLKKISYVWEEDALRDTSHPPQPGSTST